MRFLIILGLLMPTLVFAGSPKRYSTIIALVKDMPVFTDATAVMNNYLKQARNPNPIEVEVEKCYVAGDEIHCKFINSYMTFSYGLRGKDRYASERILSDRVVRGEKIINRFTVQFYYWDGESGNFHCFNYL